MARLLRLARRPSALKTLAPTPLAGSFVGTGGGSTRTYITSMRHSAFTDTLLRILRTEITYETDTRPPRPPPANFRSFSVDDRPGEQWIVLRRRHGANEDVKIDATMFDDAIPVKGAPVGDAGETDARFHISLIVEVSKGEAADCVLNFVCSAWPESLDVEKVYPVSRGISGIKPYMGPDFRELDEELQNAARDYLEERGINDELAEFLHEYMANKDRSELVGWLKNVESYVKK